VSISESAQTTEVIFAPGDHPFSVDTFKAALKQADVEVVSMDVDACGRVERDGEERVLRAGAASFVLRSSQAAPDGQSVCVAGRLQEEEGGRMNLLVSRVDVASTSGS
jgi:hypothetical protein